MGDYSSIEWTDTTWNPTTGCTKVTEGCKNCYAERLSLNLQRRGVKKFANGFELTLHPEALELPLRWKKPRRIFVNSMSDTFHEEVQFDFTRQVFDVMERAAWHVYQILTKRPHIMLEFIEQYGTPPPYVWLGTSVENARYNPRVDVLKQVDAKIRFVSFEPLLGSCLEPDGHIDLEGIAWAITGGESDYKKPRPADPDWFREIRDECIRQGVAYFHKQNGGSHKCKCHNAWGCRLLDGRTWDEFPVIENEPTSMAISS